MDKVKTPRAFELLLGRKEKPSVTIGSIKTSAVSLPSVESESIAPKINGQKTVTSYLDIVPSDGKGSSYHETRSRYS